MRLVVLVVGIPALAAMAWACSNASTGTGTGSSSCSDDSDCGDGEICDTDVGECTEGSGGPTGTTTGGTTTGTGNTTTATVVPVTPQEICQAYLECLAATEPGAVAAAMDAYGESGTCWQGGADTAAVCATACEEGMKGKHSKDPEACPECLTSNDCTNFGENVCSVGTCVACASDADCPASAPICGTDPDSYSPVAKCIVCTQTEGCSAPTPACLSEYDPDLQESFYYCGECDQTHPCAVGNCDEWDDKGCLTSCEDMFNCTINPNAYDSWGYFLLNPNYCNQSSCPQFTALAQCLEANCNIVSTEWFSYTGCAEGKCGDLYDACLSAECDPQVPTCSSTDDGKCDEPEGSGDCAEGTDVNDCVLAASCEYQADCSACQTCAMDSPCASQLAACEASASCVNLWNCLTPCTTQACADSCFSQYSSGLGVYSTLLQCVLCEQCLNACDPVSCQ